MKPIEPTTAQNAVLRLFVRYSLLYIAAVFPGVWLARHAAVFLLPPDALYYTLLPVLLAALAAFFTVSNLLLTFLVTAHAFCDTALLYRTYLLVQNGSSSILHFNICLCLLLIGAALLFYEAARASYFAFVCDKRDLQLLLSKQFWLYLLEVAIPLALAAALMAVFRRFLESIPLLV